MGYSFGFVVVLARLGRFFGVGFTTCSKASFVVSTEGAALVVAVGFVSDASVLAVSTGLTGSAALAGAFVAVEVAAFTGSALAVSAGLAASVALAGVRFTGLAVEAVVLASALAGALPGAATLVAATGFTSVFQRESVCPPSQLPLPEGSIPVYRHRLTALRQCLQPVLELPYEQCNDVRV